MTRARLNAAKLLQHRMLAPDAIAARLRQAAAEARDDLWSFRQYLHSDMHPCWWQRNVAGHLMQFWRQLQAGSRPKLILQAPPQHGKTEQLCDFIAWCSGRDPELKTIFTSYSDDLIVSVNLALQRILDSPRYQLAFGNTQLASDANAGLGVRSLRNLDLLEFVAHRGSFRCTTVLGQINGQGLDLGIIDDPIKGRREAQSKTTRDATWHWLTDDFFGRFSETAGLIIIMTRWHVDDPIGRWLERFPDTKVLRYSALAEADDWTVRQGYRRAGEPLFPEHKSLDFLLERRKLLTEAGWASIYQQQPIVVGGGLFPIERFPIVASIDRNLIKRSVRYIDKAATAGGGAYTAMVLMHQLSDGRYVVEDVKHGQWSALDREQRLAQTAKADASSYKRYAVWLEQEPGSGGKESAESSIRRLAGLKAYADKVTGSKEVRAEPYAAQVQAGNVVLVDGPWLRDFLDEHETFPSGRRKDMVDAASGAFTKLAAPAGYDTSLAWVDGTPV